METLYPGLWAYVPANFEDEGVSVQTADELGVRMLQTVSCARRKSSALAVSCVQLKIHLYIHCFIFVVFFLFGQFLRNFMNFS